MLNKLHVEKNNLGKLSELPVIYQACMDTQVELYKEERLLNGGIIFTKDNRPRIEFKDPITKTKNQMKPYTPFEGSLTQQLKGLTARVQGSGQRKYSSVAPTGLGEEEFGHHDAAELCLRMDQKYFESCSSRKSMSQSSSYQSGPRQNCRRKIDLS